jgi:hypothetical protein
MPTQSRTGQQHVHWAGGVAPRRSIVDTGAGTSSLSVLRVRRRPERRCWFTPGRLTAADLQVRVQELQHYRLARRSCKKASLGLRSSRAAAGRLRRVCLDRQSPAFFRSSAEMAKARVSGGPPNRSAETVSKPQAFVTKAIPWRSNEVRSNTSGFRPFQPVLVFASSHHIALVQPGTGLNSSSMNSESFMMSSRDAPNSAFPVTSVGGTS